MNKQNNNRATAVVDVDGVLADFESAFCDAFGNRNRHLYKLEERYPHLHPDLIAEWVNSEDNYVNLSPIFGGMLLIRQLEQREFGVVLMTSRAEHLEPVTRAWLKLYNIEPAHLYFGQHKAEAIQEINQIRSAVNNPNKVVLFVDDSVSQLEQVKKLNPSVTCLAWEQEWSKGWYPRIRYNGSNYLLEGNNGNGQWKDMWSK